MERSNRIVAGAVSGALAALLAMVAAQAVAQEARKYELADTATVKTVDVEAGTFTVSDGVAATIYAVEDVSVIQEGDREISLGELEPGDRVAVSARSEPTDELPVPVADVVKIVQDSELEGDPDAAPAKPDEGGS